ncbi:MAG: methylmalonyl-CoA epimerase [candidate division Zixibacteria bacterium]|nr:methylmalonyl-CoA epimerase [candidate division Zixibacteria bacterium]
MGRIPGRNLMKPKKLTHIGIAVNNLDEILEIFEKQFGLKCDSRIKSEPHGVEAATVHIGDAHFEFMQPLKKDSPMQRFIDKKGPSIHHLSMEVDDVNEWIDKLEAGDVRMVDKRARPGVHGNPMAFIHPKSTGGILVEIEQFDE